MRAVAPFLAALLGFFVAQQIVLALRPWPADYGLAAKVEHLAQHGDRYDVVLIGSSGTYYGLRPRTIEAELAKRGEARRVFNLGVGGMGSYEQVHLVRWVLDHMRPEVILYEEPRFDPLLWYPDIRNPRYVHWHDARTTLAALRGLAYVDEPPSYKKEQYEATWHGNWKLALALEHLELFVLQATALGDGPRIAAHWFGYAPERRPRPAELEAEAGWLDIGVEPDEGAQRQNQKFRADVAGWDAVVAAVREANDRRVDLDTTFDREAFADLRALFRDRGVTVGYYAIPRSVGDPILATLAESGELAPFFAYNRPELAPELFDPALRWDPNHLDANGAERFSTRLAGDLAQLLAERAAGADPARREH